MPSIHRGSMILVADLNLACSQCHAKDFEIAIPNDPKQDAIRHFLSGGTIRGEDENGQPKEIG